MLSGPSLERETCLWCLRPPLFRVSPQSTATENRERHHPTRGGLTLFVFFVRKRGPLRHSGNVADPTLSLHPSPGPFKNFPCSHPVRERLRAATFLTLTLVPCYKYKNAILSYYNNHNLSKTHGNNGVKYVTENMQKEYLLSKFLFQLNNKAKELSLNINI